MDAASSQFEAMLRRVESDAFADIIALIHRKLALNAEGQIQQTPNNIKLLRQLDELLKDAMDRAGLQRVITEFVSHYPEALPQFHDILMAVAHGDNVRPPTVAFNPQDKAVFQGYQATSIEALNGAIDATLNRVVNRVIFNFGGMKFSDLVKFIHARFSTTVAQATSLARTSQMVYYRTVSALGFQKLEKTMPADLVRYRYAGPDDKVTRAFCHNLLLLDREYTRIQIDNMDNGEMPNVWTSCGGFNCRHQWVISLVPLT